MLGWFLRFFKSEISLSAVDGIPSSSLSNFMCLIATTLPWALIALKTLPKAPSPIWQTYLYS
jgi:hypothetical protein